MNDNEIIFQKGRPISLQTSQAIWDGLSANTLETVQAGEIDACHKPIATMAIMLKIIKDLGTYNESLSADKSEAQADDGPSETLAPHELRARLARYLARLDAELGLVTLSSAPDE